jgi:hypothetical protein
MKDRNPAGFILSQHRIVEIQKCGVATSDLFYAEPGMSGSPIFGI